MYKRQISKASSSRFSRCCGCSFIGRNCTLSLAPILDHVIANLLLNRGETLNRKCRRSNRARCAQSSIENSFRRRGRGRATPSSSSRRDSLIARRYPQWRRFTLTGVSIWPITYYLTLSNCVEEMPKAALSKAVLHGQRVGLVCIMNTPFSITISY